MKIRSLPLIYISLLCLFTDTANIKLLANQLNNVGDKNNNFLDRSYFKKNSEDEYIIGSGDTLKVIVSEEYPELTSIVSVDGEGKIFLPKLKRIYVAGLSLNEVNKLLNESYKEFVNFPNLEVEVVSYRPINIIVKGEVMNPGQYRLQGSLTADTNPIANFNINKGSYFKQPELSPTIGIKEPTQLNFYFPTVNDAIRTSGGITKYSDLKKVKIIRIQSISKGGGKKYSFLNFEDSLINGDKSQNIRIYDGDIIVVAKSSVSISKNNLAIKSSLNPKFMRVFVVGRVKLPGSKIIGSSSSMNDAIEIAGGTKFFKGPIKYLSINNDGTVDKRIIKYRKKNKEGTFNNPYLKDGDLVIVGDSLLSTSSEILQEATAPFQGIYSTIKLIELFSE